MGADPSQCADILCALAKDFAKQPEAVQADRRKIAKAVRKTFAQADFNDSDLDCYEQLFTLGLAKRCDRCKHAYTDWSADEHDGDECEA